MSNRNIKLSSKAAEYKLCLLAQIDALTREGLSDEQRVNLFADAAGFSDDELEDAHYELFQIKNTALISVWEIGYAERSIFAYLPGCHCPAHAVNEELDGQTIIHPVYADRSLTPSELLSYARVQFGRRFPNEIWDAS